MISNLGFHILVNTFVIFQQLTGGLPSKGIQFKSVIGIIDKLVFESTGKLMTLIVGVGCYGRYN